MDKAKKISKDYADHHTCYACDTNLQYIYTRKAVEFGYHQARKDLQLTYKDIQRILDIADELAINYRFEKVNQLDDDYCKEVLDRYVKQSENY